MTNISKFSKRMDALGKRLIRNTDKLMRATILSVNSAVVLATPVDTGRARSNWRTKAGSMDGKVMPTPGAPSIGQ